MNLTAEQKQTVATWLAAGASIASVQRRLREEFKISLTYIDTRLLIDDLGLNVAKPPPPLPKKEATPLVGNKPGDPPAADGAAIDANAEYLDEGEAFPDVPEDLVDATPKGAAGAGSVKVDVDRIMRPGSVVSGSVTFSDGNTGTWALDQFGRLVFEGKDPAYRPSQADLQVFQRELSKQLQRQGY